MPARSSSTIFGPVIGSIAGFGLCGACVKRENSVCWGKDFVIIMKIFDRKEEEERKEEPASILNPYC